MARRIYQDEERLRAGVQLLLNDGNLKKTARELDLPVGTLRHWRDQFEIEGYPDPVEVLPDATRESFIEEALSTRWEMLTLLRQKIAEGNATPRDLITGIGILTDKILVMQGHATSRTETVKVSLPDASEIARELAAFVEKNVSDAQQRHDEINAPVEAKKPLLSIVNQ